MPRITVTTKETQPITMNPMNPDLKSSSRKRRRYESPSSLEDELQTATSSEDGSSSTAESLSDEDTEDHEWAPTVDQEGTVVTSAKRRRRRHYDVCSDNEHDHASLHAEVRMLQTNVSTMERQLATASAKIQELRLLVTFLAQCQGAA